MQPDNRIAAASNNTPPRRNITLPELSSPRDNKQNRREVATPSSTYLRLREHLDQALLARLRLENAVVVKQRLAVLDAPSAVQEIDGLADGDAEPVHYRTRRSEGRYSVCTSTTPATAFNAPAICGETL